MNVVEVNIAHLASCATARPRILSAQRILRYVLGVLHAPVLNRLGDVCAAYFIFLREVGDSARHLEHAMVAARRQVEANDGLLEQCRAFCIGRAMLVDFPGSDMGVGLALTRVLLPVGRFDAFAYRAAGLAAGAAREFFLRHRWHFQLQVDAVQQRAGNLAAVARHLVGRAMATAGVMAEIPAGTGTRCLFAIRPGVPQVIEKKAL